MPSCIPAALFTLKSLTPQNLITPLSTDYIYSIIYMLPPLCFWFLFKSSWIHNNNNKNNNNVSLVSSDIHIYTDTV